ncbi:MAG: hypothetical protein ACI9BF_000659 [Candidatus Paceibacteria bacterium]|jgi:hypothetical protein
MLLYTSVQCFPKDRPSEKTVVEESDEIIDSFIRIAYPLWTEDEKLYLVGGTGDGGYWMRTYYEFDLQNHFAKSVFSAGGVECPSNTFSILGDTYWLHDTQVDYDVCLDSPQNSSSEGYEVYAIDRSDWSQEFVQIVNTQEDFMDLYAQKLPKIILDDFNSR